MRLGIDILIDDRSELLEGKRIGLLTHDAGRGRAGDFTVDRLGADDRWKVTALFGPEHGIETKAQDMEPVKSRTDSASSLPIYSLYGDTLESLEPTPEMLDKIDLLVIDLQDIGSRYYTYVWTAVLCVEACRRAGKAVIVCDRPNPICGDIVEGGAIEAGFGSFVGLRSIPVRHGMTIGEIVQLMNDRAGGGGDLTIIPMEGWKRGMAWADTALSWINPSPNMRSYLAALLYPGMCLLEGTNLSEGRGTDTPFEIVGAPFIDTDELMESFECLKLPGVRAAPTSFIPTMQKWMGNLCHGVRWVITDPDLFCPYFTGLAFVWLCHKLYRDKGFMWRADPYEFVTDRPAIDMLTGSAKFREGIAGLSLDDLKKLSLPPKRMLDERDGALIYTP
jgi:uncharacterized protein YbbC (DUF1343 family)